MSAALAKTLRLRVAGWLVARVSRRSPDVVIGSADDPYLLRWWVIPRNPVFNVYLHCFKRSDDDRALHTHPWLFNLSWLLLNSYREWVGDFSFFDHRAGDVKFRWGAAAHRIELTHGDCWTLFVTGPRIREWGFLCPRGFVHWREFTAPHNPGEIGRGCE